MKLISTRTHGIMDYLTVVLLLALPRLLGWRGAVSRFVVANALGALVYSLLTRYELGALKLLPMKAHLGLDGMSALSFLGAPLLFAGEETGVKASLAGIGLYELAVTLATETEPGPSVEQTGEDPLAEVFGRKTPLFSAQGQVEAETA